MSLVGAGFFVLALAIVAAFIGNPPQVGYSGATPPASASSGNQPDVSSIADATNPEPGRPVYPYSIVNGGVANVEELKSAIESDPVVRAHFANFDLSKTRVEQLARPRLAHVSYRVGNEVFWTRRPLLLRAGEKVLTDGTHTARTRCANQVADTPVVVAANEPPSALLDTPLARKPGAVPTFALGTPVQPHSLPPGTIPPTASSYSPLPPGAFPGAVGGVPPGSAPSSSTPADDGYGSPGPSPEPPASGNPDARPGSAPPSPPPAGTPPPSGGQLPPTAAQPPSGNPFGPPDNPLSPPGNPGTPENPLPPPGDPGTPKNPLPPPENPVVPPPPSPPDNPGNPTGNPPNNPPGNPPGNPGNPPTNEPEPIPEPATIALLLTGAAACTLRRRSR